MINPVPSLVERMRDVRASVMIAIAILVLAALDSSLAWFTPSLLLTTAHRPANPMALSSFLFASPGGMDALPAAAILFYFGRDLEKKLGGWQFLGVYLVCALAGAGVESMVPRAPLGGGPAGAVGLLVVYAYLWPLNRVRMFNVVTIGPRELLLIMVGYRFLWRFGTSGMGGGTGIGVLGGAAAGALVCAWLAHTSSASKYRRTLRTATVGDAASWSSVDWDGIALEGLHPLTVEELERVRAKADDQGIRSLSDEERAFVHRLRLRTATTSSEQTADEARSEVAG
ncbi:MAG TPA: rhomboid family intramembrane serine protease [Gemmatimonadaceae bacterium]|nr:rhomboid family intramembrane serine protease [Gemmatimonadaceae bacterium]